ncbi:MAG: hypothetical protein ACM3XM_16255 [Mycobacterium leprae]
MLRMWLLAVGSILLGAVGQLLIKFGLNGLGGAGTGAVAFLWSSLRSPWVAGGIGAYGLSVLLWLLALREAPLSLLYPLVSLSYVVVVAGSALLLGESLSWGRVGGIGLILLGVLVVARWS